MGDKIAIHHPKTTRKSIVNCIYLMRWSPSLDNWEYPKDFQLFQSTKSAEFLSTISGNERWNTANQINRIKSSNIRHYLYNVVSSIRSIMQSVRKFYFVIEMTTCVDSKHWFLLGQHMWVIDLFFPIQYRPSKGWLDNSKWEVDRWWIHISVLFSVV